MSAEYLRETAQMMRDLANSDPQPSVDVRVLAVWLHSRRHLTITPDALLAVADLMQTDADAEVGEDYDQAADLCRQGLLTIARTWRGDA